MNTRLILFGLAACATLCFMPETACAKFIRMIFETSAGKNLGSAGQAALAGSGTIGAYDVTGVPIKPTLVSGLSGPIDSADLAGIAASADGKTLFVANVGTGTIGEYDAMTGAAIDPSLITGLKRPVGIALKGNDLFVVNRKGTVGKYDATTGAAINAALVSKLLNVSIGIAVEGGDLFITNHTGAVVKYDTITKVTSTLVTKKQGLNNTEGIAVDGGKLFVVNRGGTIGEYDATTGATVNAALVKTGLKGPIGIAVSEGKLFVVNSGVGTIGEYDETTGATVNPALVTGLNGPTGIVVVTKEVQSVPEACSTWTLLLLGVTAMFALKTALSRPEAKALATS